jgi:hypothetical protein
MNLLDFTAEETALIAIYAKDCYRQVETSQIRQIRTSQNQ